MQQEEAVRQEEAAVRTKVAARVFAREYLSDVVSSAMDNLNDAGFFYDVVEREVETQFMPWLAQQAAAHHTRALVARELVAQMVAAAATRHRTHYEQLDPE